MKQLIDLDKSTCIMQLILTDSELALRALKGAIRKMNPHADISRLTDGDGKIYIGSPGPVIEYGIVPGYKIPRASLYHNGAVERTSELIDIFIMNYLKMPRWVCDN